MTPEQEIRTKALELNFEWKSRLAAAAIQAQISMKDMNPLDQEDLDQICAYISEGKLPEKKP